MKVLIAGGAGFIGTSLVDKLLDKGYDVNVLDYCLFGNYIDHRATLIKKNIFDITQQEIESYNAVVFMAGMSNDPMANFNPSRNFVDNTAAPLYLSYICKESNIDKFIYASSCSVYGFTNNQLMKEDTETQPQYPYGISKLAAETAIKNMTDSNFRPIFLRKGTVGGYSRRMRFDLVINTMVKTALTNGEIIVNSPDLWRPLIDIRDVCDAYIKAIECDSTISGIYNIAEDNYTIGNLAKIIAFKLKEYGYEINVVYHNEEDIRNYKACTKKAKADLQFEAAYKPDDTVAFIMDNINDVKDFNDDKYYNIQTLRHLNEK